MSFENYQNFPSQQGGQDGGAGPGGPPQQEQQMGGQIPDNGGQFPGGDPSSAGGQSQGGDEKTTLWYDSFQVHPLWLFYIIAHVRCLLARFYYEHAHGAVADFLLGWASSNHGLTRILYVLFGTTWVSRSMSR